MGGSTKPFTHSEQAVRDWTLINADMSAAAKRDALRVIDHLSAAEHSTYKVSEKDLLKLVYNYFFTINCKSSHVI